MAMAAQDVSMLVVSDNARSEQRITPSWTLDRLRQKLEPITGVPIAAQSLSVRAQGQSVSLDLDGATVLSPYLSCDAEIHVKDTRPPGARENYTDVSAVQKYEMPQAEYETRTDTVLAWKKANKLGRFDPDAPSLQQKHIQDLDHEIADSGIRIDCRVRLLPADDARRGKVGYIGPVEHLPGVGPWIGVLLDEPCGKNDGSLQGTRYFDCPKNCGVFVRPHRLEVGDFPPDSIEDEF